MNTAKPISSISFNTEQALRAVLDRLIKAKRLDFWAYVRHKGEDDEAGKKDHFHLYAEPAKRLQTADLKEEFNEYDPTHPDKPLSCMSFRNSKFGDWYLYGLHDPQYLKAKDLEKKFHYSHDDVVSSDEDELRCRVYEVDMADITPIKRLSVAVESGKTFAEAVSAGLVPIPQINQYNQAWQCLIASLPPKNEPHAIIRTNRGEIVDAATGEQLWALFRPGEKLPFGDDMEEG